MWFIGLHTVNAGQLCESIQSDTKDENPYR